MTIQLKLPKTSKTMKRLGKRKKKRQKKRREEVSKTNSSKQA